MHAGEKNDQIRANSGTSHRRNTVQLKTAQLEYWGEILPCKASQRRLKRVWYKQSKEEAQAGQHDQWDADKTGSSSVAAKSAPPEKPIKELAFATNCGASSTRPMSILDNGCYRHNRVAITFRNPHTTGSHRATP
jgi:hypothetical protein